MHKRKANPQITLLVPVFNEEKSVGIFIETVEEKFQGQDFDFDYLFIDDGSSDGTLEKLTELSKKNHKIKVIVLSRNFGKEAAMTAGIDQASGDALVPIDVDLQDPPELIIDFVEQWRAGYDVVYGKRSSRGAEGLIKSISSQWFYKVFNFFSHTKIPEDVGDFRLIDRRVIEVIKRLPERNRFMKGLFAWAGFKSKSVPYVRPDRAAGTSSWNYWRLWNFAIDGVVGFSTSPLRVWSYFGFIISALAFAYGSFIVYMAIFSGVDTPGYASTMIVILFLGGIQLISIGILGEYLGRLFVEVKGRPVYIVDRLISEGDEKAPPMLPSSD